MTMLLVEPTTKMIVNDENKDMVCPLLTKSTHGNNNNIAVESSQSHSNHNPSILSLNNIKTNQTNVLLSHKNASKSVTISFERINYTINPTTTSQHFLQWRKLLSCCKHTLNKQILFNLSGVFKPGMNAILGMCHL